MHESTAFLPIIFRGYVIQAEFCWKKGGLKLAFTAENL